MRPATLPLTLALVMMLAATPAFAVQPGEQLADPGLEARARALSADLRCLVCQNQSIDDSDAPLAKDLRLLVRERLAAGDSDRAVMDFVVQRYGDFVLLKPPFRAGTLLLWIGPFLILAAGALALLLKARGRRTEVALAEAAPLSPDEEARVKALTEGRSG